MLHTETVTQQYLHTAKIPTSVNKNNYNKSIRDLFLSVQQANITLRDIFIVLIYDFCEDCNRIMAALPQGAFAACKLREHYNERNLLVVRMKSGNGANTDSKNTDTKNMNANKKLLEYSPVKYNGKLMNSIWGLYNRYSPHNIKGNEYDGTKSSSYMQQHQAVASSIANDMAMGLCTGKK